MLCGAVATVVVPLLAVANQVGPQNPVEIRLLSMFWWSLAFAFAGALAYLCKRFGAQLSLGLGAATLAVVAWNTHVYQREGELSSVEKQFDSFSQYVVQKAPCHLVDTMGWSSAVDALYSAVWPGSQHPVVAPLEVIELDAKPGDAVCRYEANRIVESGRVKAQRQCDMTAPLGVELAYDGARIAFDFSSNVGDVFYVEVPGKYVLRLPSKLTGAFPDTSRFAEFRVLAVRGPGELTCSPILHFSPSKPGRFVWRRTEVGRQSQSPTDY